MDKDGKTYRIFVINPGSTSTKLAYFENDEKKFETSVFHDAPELAKFGSAANQFGFRKQVILDFLEDNGIDLTGVDAIVGRGGSTVSVSSGTYEINEKLISDTADNVGGVDHPANLGVPLAAELAGLYGARAFMVDSPKTDEFIDEARITGIDGVYRVSSLHTLNLKGTARLWCREHGVRYEDARLIVCHIDGGMSVSAHDHGKMIDGTNNAWGEGPFTPTRVGALPAYLAATYFDGKDPKVLRDACTKSGGFVSHFGTSDSDRVHDMVLAGDEKAARVWNAMIYNICKSIGSMAAALSGDVDAVICGGGLLRFDDLCSQIERRCVFIAPVFFYPGEVEHEAMAAGALRVLRGGEEPLVYTGEPVWKGFDD